jgi:Uncharacterized conserved protein (DUF2358)
MMIDATLQVILYVLAFAMSCDAYIPLWNNCAARNHRLFVLLNDKEDSMQVFSHDKSDASSKGFVSILTNVVNSLAGTKEMKASISLRPSPRTPNELMERIREDYVEKNYLWTGDIDTSSFETDCRFMDPTLSFIGTDTFKSNVQNLRPIVDALILPGGCRSELLSIEMTSDFVQSRWNMVGNLTGLPWKPRIDVIGRTKFWFRSTNENEFRVYFYDECWEMPAAKALLQLITPAGTISNEVRTIVDSL